MKLKELLDKTSYSFVKIGSESGFVYCGVPDEDEIAKVSMEECAKLTKSIGECVRSLVDCENPLVDRVCSATNSELKKFLELRGELRGIEDYDQLSRAVRKRNKVVLYNFISKRASAVKRIQDLAKDLAPWIGLLEREVVESYESFSEPDTLIIIVEGHERGLYWDRAEYENGVASDEDTDV